jgi:cell division protein FtsI/penicillin-binding protein 2
MHREAYAPRLILVGLMLLGAFAVLGYQLYGIQVRRHDELYEKAKVKYTASSTRTGRRGQVLDVQGHLLAGNLACRDVLAEPRRFKEEAPVLVQFLSRRLGLPTEALAAKFALAYSAERPLVEVVLHRGLDMKEAQQLQEDLRQMKIKGIRFVDSSRRYYPKQTLLANVLGFVDSGGLGVSGVEKMMDAELQPTRSVTVFERDRKGVPIPSSVATDEEPRNGKDIYLTIDETIQQLVETELRHLAETFQPRAAYGIMADPRTGAILAMAQYPTFNPNDRRQMDPAAWQNRMLVEGFEPGSIMKSVAIAGALDYGVVSLNDRFFCENGMWWFHGRSLRDSGHRYGWLTVREIVQKSSNIGTAKIAVERLGERRLYQVFHRFGFGRPTGIGLDNEAPGIFRPLERWDGLSITRFPIGQGILATPVQMVQAYCTRATSRC